jgi:hypothetical protein
VHVVDQQRGRLLAREQVEQRGECAVVTEALGRPALRALLSPCVTRDPGQHGREVGHAVVAEGLEPARVQPRDVVVERIDHDAEGNVLLVLGGAAVEHGEPGRRAGLAEVGEQRALADSRLAQQGDDLALPARGDSPDGSREQGFLPVAPHQRGVSLSDRHRASICTNPRRPPPPRVRYRGTPYGRATRPRRRWNP